MISEQIVDQEQTVYHSPKIKQIIGADLYFAVQFTHQLENMHPLDDPQKQKVWAWASGENLLQPAIYATSARGQYLIPKYYGDLESFGCDFGSRMQGACSVWVRIHGVSDQINYHTLGVVNLGNKYGVFDLHACPCETIGDQQAIIGLLEKYINPNTKRTFQELETYYFYNREPPS